MAEPWYYGGHDTTTLDVLESKHKESPLGKHYQVDIRTFMPPPLKTFDLVFASPPCDHMAITGARWFQGKGLMKLAESIELVAHAVRIAELVGAEWMIEHPVSTLATYWRKPDAMFHPWQYGDNYTKKTCIWHSSGFIMPEPTVLEEPPDLNRKYIHHMPGSKAQAYNRAKSSRKFARAVYLANKGE